MKLNELKICDATNKQEDEEAKKKDEQKKKQKDFFLNHKYTQGKRNFPSGFQVLSFSSWIKIKRFHNEPKC